MLDDHQRRSNSINEARQKKCSEVENALFHALGRPLDKKPGTPSYVNAINIQHRTATYTIREGVMPIIAKLDELGRPAWILLMILGFTVWWPAGFLVLAFIIGSGRMGPGYLQEKMEHLGRGNWWSCHNSSGNRAFDEYRTGALKRLEDEQREFREFLERLRQAKDKTEFDQFMAERRNRPPK
jgi:hypothetical protein